MNPEERVKKIIIDIMGLNNDSVMYSCILVDDMPINEDPSFPELIVALEKEFNTKLSDEQSANLTSARTLIDAFVNT